MTDLFKTWYRVIPWRRSPARYGATPDQITQALQGLDPESKEAIRAFCRVCCIPLPQEDKDWMQPYNYVHCPGQGWVIAEIRKFLDWCQQNQLIKADPSVSAPVDPIPPEPPKKRRGRPKGWRKQKEHANNLS